MWITVVVLLVVAILAVLAGVFGLVWFFSGAERINRALRKIPVTRVADALPGEMARVVGKLKPAGGPLLRAPLSGQPCGYFQAVAQEWRPSGNAEGWVQLAYEEQWCDFCLDDGTGKVLIRMLRSQISADLEEASFSDPTMPPNPAQEGFLRRHQAWSPNDGKPRARLRYLESLFEQDEVITAYGVVRIESEGDGLAGVRVVLEAPIGAPLLVSDDKHIARAPSPGSTVLTMSAIR
jgi:hypothetical protein